MRRIELRRLTTKTFPAFLSTRLTARQIHVNRVIWGCIGILAAVNALIAYALGLHIQWEFPVKSLFVIGGYIGVGLFCRYLWRNDTLAICCHVLGQLPAIALASTVISYLGARLDLPMITDKLIAADALLGFEWRRFMLGYYKLGTVFPWLLPLMHSAYDSFEIQAFILLPLLCLCGQSLQGQRFVIVMFAAAVLVVLISTLLPSETTYAYYEKHLAVFQQWHSGAAETLLSVGRRGNFPAFSSGPGDAATPARRSADPGPAGE